MSDSHRLNTSSIRQEEAEYLLYQLKLLKDADLVAVAEKKIMNMVNFCKGKNVLSFPHLLQCILPIDLLNFCFTKGITDSDVVAAVLQCIYQWFQNDKIRDGAFIDFFLFYWSTEYRPRMGVLLLLTSNLSQGNESSRCFAHLSYYLKHATRKKLILGGRRLSEIICEFNSFGFFTKTCERDFLLPLLQYGGKFLSEKESSEKVNYIFIVLVERLFHLQRQNPQGDDNLLLRYALSDQWFDLKNTRESLELLLKSVRNPYETTYLIGNHETSRHRRFAVPLPDIDELRVIYETSFPRMGFGYRNPASLKHSCRYVIRERLNENWELPDGIKKLGLPKAFCNYINLLDE